MQPFKVVPVDKISDLPARVPDVFIIFQVNLVIFQRAEPAFDHNVVGPAAFAVHADFHRVLFYVFDVVMAGKLAALIRIENFGSCHLERIFQGTQYHRRRQGVIQLPADDTAAVPVDDRGQIDKSMV